MENIKICLRRILELIFSLNEENTFNQLTELIESNRIAYYLLLDILGSLRGFCTYVIGVLDKEQFSNMKSFAEEFLSVLRECVIEDVWSTPVIYPKTLVTEPIENAQIIRERISGLEENFVSMMYTTKDIQKSIKTLLDTTLKSRCPICGSDLILTVDPDRKYLILRCTKKKDHSWIIGSSVKVHRD